MAPRVPAPNSRLPALERGEVIQRAALTLFAHRGYASTSVTDIVDAAGVTKPMMYRHWESKRDLAIWLLEHYRSELIDSALSQYDPHDPAIAELTPDVRVGRMIDGWLAWTEQHSDAVRLLFTPIRGDAEVESTQADLHTRGKLTQAAMLREFAPDLPDEQLEALAEGTFAGYASVALWQGDEPSRREPAREALMRLTLGALGLPVNGS